MTTNLELRRKLAQASESGRFMVTVSYIDSEKKTLENYFMTQEFPREEIPKALDVLTRMLLEELDQSVKKDNP